MKPRTMKEICTEILYKLMRKGDGKMPTIYHVSSELRIPYPTVCTQRKRNSIPYKEILDWCNKTDTDPMKIFYTKEKHENNFQTV